MFNRFVVAAIVLFWGWMTAQLIRTEMFSSEGKSLPVPVEFVSKLMFRHEQTADLTLFSQGRRLDGTLHLQPKHFATGAGGRESPLDVLTGNGSFALNLPGVNVQRIVVRGVAEFTDQQQLQRLEITASLHEAKQTGPGVTLTLEGDPVHDQWHFVLRQKGEIVREETGAMSKLLTSADPHIPGLPFNQFAELQRQQISSARVAAHRGFLRVSGEDVETFVVSIQQGETTECRVYLNQLGQILAVKTFAGYDLYDEGVSP